MLFRLILSVIFLGRTDGADDESEDNGDDEQEYEFDGLAGVSVAGGIVIAAEAVDIEAKPRSR